MDERHHRELALQAVRRLRRTVIQEAFALDALASPDPVVQGVIDVLRATASAGAAIENSAEQAAERERVQ